MKVAIKMKMMLPVVSAVMPIRINASVLIRKAE